MNREILYAITPGKPRRHQNPLFGFSMLAASVITAILTAVFFALASEDSNTPFDMFQWLAYIMLIATVVAISMGTYFTIAGKKYIQYCESIYKDGKKYNATIIDVFEKKTISQNGRVDYYYAIKFSYTECSIFTETTPFIFGKSEIEYYKSLNLFPIIYNKDKNLYLYLLYVEESTLIDKG